MDLARERCSPARAAAQLSEGDADRLLRQVPGWTRDQGHIRRVVTMSGFRQAVSLVVAVADLAEADDHHPEICVAYNRVTITLTTHKVDGLSLCDFILAAKIDQLPMLPATDGAASTD